MSDEVIRAKWAMDGAATLSEAAGKLREFADSLEKLEAEGWQLTQPVGRRLRLHPLERGGYVRCGVIGSAP